MVSILIVVILVLLIVLGLSLAAIIIVWRLWRQLSIKRRFESISQISIKDFGRIVSLHDEYHDQFIDGTYSIVFQINPHEVSRILATVPSWADGSWSAGRKNNLASRLIIPASKTLMSIKGQEGETIHRVLSIDTATGLVYFELKEF